MLAQAIASVLLYGADQKSPRFVGSGGEPRSHFSLRASPQVRGMGMGKHQLDLLPLESGFVASTPSSNFEESPVCPRV